MKVLSIDMPGKRTGGFVFANNGTLTHGRISFQEGSSEADDYRTIATLIAECQPDVVVLEQAYLYLIAGLIGGAKMYCALHHIPWFAVGASRAKKLLLKNGRASKQQTLAWAEAQLSKKLDVHTADAYLYLETWYAENEKTLSRPERERKSCSITLHSQGGVSGATSQDPAGRYHP